MNFFSLLNFRICKYHISKCLTFKEDKPCGRAAIGIGIGPIDCWDCGFESRWVHTFSSLEFVVCYVGTSHCDELISRSEEFYRVFVCECIRINARDVESKTMRGPRTELGCCTKDKTIFNSPQFQKFLHITIRSAWFLKRPVPCRGFS